MLLTIFTVPGGGLREEVGFSTLKCLPHTRRLVCNQHVHRIGSAIRDEVVCFVGVHGPMVSQ